MPEAADVHVDGPAVLRHGSGVSRGVAAGWRDVAAPDLLDEIRAAEHRRGMGGEEGQQLELLEGQHDLATARPGPPLHMIETDAGVGVRAAFGGRIGLRRLTLVTGTVCRGPATDGPVVAPFVVAPFVVAPFVVAMA
jgi:hypothetical protein